MLLSIEFCVYTAPKIVARVQLVGLYHLILLAKLLESSDFIIRFTLHVANFPGTLAAVNCSAPNREIQWGIGADDGELSRSQINSTSL